MNNEKTALFKMYFILCLVIMVFISQGITVQAKTVNTGEVVAYMNALRGELGLPAFTVSDSLNQAASVRAGELAVRFDHTRPDGSAWYTVGTGVNGENLARADKEEEKGTLNIIAGWYLSPSHRANLLSGSTQIGIAAYEDANGVAYIACEFN
ncbi:MULTISPECIES: CAP domain-containing protein [unclassified Butyrivibrio]|uniref:CAP domain-containing protein n=1 Tax=unclassified Butyrivibrio TaxID=2639466 RepID=UPI0004246B45|nr:MULTISPECIES: CAP domain-containing protein [unclassified Butyrivibrio]